MTSLLQDIELPDSYVDRMRKEGTVLELSLKEAIRLALNNNLEIAIENFNEDLNRTQIIRSQGFYDPVFAFTLGWTSSESPTRSELDAGGGVRVSQFKSFTFNNQFIKNIPGGSTFTASWNNTRQDTNSLFAFLNPSYNTGLRFQFTQPLLRGFRETSTQRQIKIANLDTQISDTQFKQRVSEIVQQVQNQYWELAYAIANSETQRQSMELAIIQHRNNRKRVEIGVMAPIEITSSQAEVARRDQGFIQSEVNIINAQNGLKRLLAPDPEASIWNLTLIPLDTPEEREVVVTMDNAIQTALGNRPELERIELQQEQNEVNRAFYRREGKPTVNLRGNFGSSGITGFVDESFICPPGTSGNCLPSDDVRIGSFGGAWGQAFGFDYINWGIAVDVEIPLKNRANEADLAITAIRERQLATTVKNQQQAIIVEVRNAYETITTRKKSLDAARVARQLAQEQLDGENKRFEAGLSTNYTVLQQQRDLALARTNETRARIDYNLSLARLQRSMGTTLEAKDIQLADLPGRSDRP